MSLNRDESQNIFSHMRIKILEVQYQDMTSQPKSSLADYPLPRIDTSHRYLAFYPRPRFTSLHTAVTGLGGMSHRAACGWSYVHVGVTKNCSGCFDCSGAEAVTTCCSGRRSWPPGAGTCSAGVLVLPRVNAYVNCLGVPDSELREAGAYSFSALAYVRLCTY